MKKILLQSFLFVLLFTIVGTTTLSAQESSDSKMLTITIEMTDADGNTQIKKIVQTGDDVNEDNIQSIIDEQVGDFAGNVEVDVDLQVSSSDADESDEMEVTVDEDGNVFINGELVEEGEMENQQIFVIESDDDAGLEEVQEMLSEMDVDINIEEIIENAEASEAGEKEIRIITKSFESEEHSSSNDNKGFLGVVTDNQTDLGVEITDVVKGSAAEKMGLQVGDVIVTINGEPTKTHQDLVNQISAHQVNETIRLGYARNGNAMSDYVVLGERKLVGTFPAINQGLGLRNEQSKMSINDCSKMCESMSTEECAKICGITEAECTAICEGASRADCAKLCEGMSAEDCIRICGTDCSDNSFQRKPHLGVTISENDDNKGVFVESVQRNSPASRAGLQEGDYILKFDKEKVNSVDALINQVQNHKVGDLVKVKYSRNGKKATEKITLTPKPQRRKTKRRMRGNKGCCASPNSNSREFISEKRIIIRTITDENGNVIEEIVEGMPENTLDMVMVDVFPNPTTDEVNIRFKTEAKQATAVRILDASGKAIFVKEIPNFNGDFNEQISLRNNENGLYFLSIQQGKNTYTKRIILNN